MKYGVGIDVSKGKSTVAVLSLEGEVIEEPFEINHDINGLNLLEEKLKDIPKEDLKIVMEETGTYHLPVLGYLLDKGYFVVAENALKIKKYLDRGLRKAKTDKKDSYKLAEYTCDNWYKLNKVRDNDEIYDNLRFLSRQYINNINVQNIVPRDIENVRYYDAKLECNVLFNKINGEIEDIIEKRECIDISFVYNENKIENISYDYKNLSFDEG